MDYLLRDSHHIGVAYGRFDHYRLIDTLRILPYSEPVQRREITDAKEDENENKRSTGAPSLGVEQGGLHSAEALLLARYFMFSQVYFHPVRRIYDLLLVDFLKKWLPRGKFPTKLVEFLKYTDNEVTEALLSASANTRKPGHESARRIVSRKHFKLLWEYNPADAKIDLEAGQAVYRKAAKKFGKDAVRYDKVPPKNSGVDFPVLAKDGRIESALNMSQTLRNLPIARVETVFIMPRLRDEASKWLRENRGKIIPPRGGVG